MKLTRLILFFVVMLNTFTSSATHIVGGEMNYRYLGGNNYEIRLTVYRDCFNGVPPFDDPASIGIYNSTNQLVNLSYTFDNLTLNNQTDGYLIHPHDSSGVPNSISDPCTIPPVNICYSVCHYIDTVNLPPIAGGYHLVYQRCCRNFSIANIVNPLNVGATYDAWIPPSPYDHDSNPVYNAWPPTYICVNQPFTFDHSATDYDGDSLVYQLCDPYDGASPANPMPQPPFAPPYNTVTWQAPYSIANVFGGVPLTINPQTGWLTATPNAVGQYVYAVCVIEYRNGVPIGQTRRDFQVNIVPCSNITVSAIQSPTVSCGLTLASFTNNSTGASSYLWNFGDNTTLGDTSHVFQPSYSYPDTGIYHVMLVAYSSANPACNDTSYANIHVYPPFTTSPSFQVLPCSRTVVFTDTSSTLSGTPNSWHWNFGDGNNSTQQNPTHTYLANGNYQVTLITQTNIGCADTVVINVSVNYVQAVSAFTSANILCTNSFNFTNQSTGATSYSWNFGDASTSAQTNPSHTYASTGNYTVTLIASNASGCNDTISHIVSIPVQPQANFVYQVDSCTLAVTFTNNSTNASTYSWSFGDASSSTLTNPVHTFATMGNYNVTLIASNAAGCSDTATILVPLNFIYPVAAFTVNPVACSFSLNITNQSTGANNYLWNFGDNTTSVAQNPAHTYAQPGNYTITLVIPGTANCGDTATQSIVINPLPSASFTQVLDTCGLSAVFNNSSVNANQYAWAFGDASTSTQQNPSHSYSAPGNYTVNLTVTGINGCTATATQSFTFPPLPVAAFTVNPVVCSFNVGITNQSTGASSYNWSFGDNTTSTAQNPSHTYSQPGNYTITLIVGGATSCTDTATQNITINTLPSASFIQVLDTCGLSAAFNNTSVNATQYSWTFGDASTSTQQNPSHTYSSAGSYMVNLTATDANGCTATSSQSFTFPPLPVAAFTANPVVCSFNININNQSTGASNYSWNFGDNTTSTAQNPSHIYSQPGNYSITLIVGGVTSCTDTATQNIAINTLPSASFTQVLDTCGLSAAFNNTSVNATQYSWTFGDASTSTQQNPSHTYSSSGSYTVNLTATDANGCTATSSQSFTFPPLPVAAFTANPVVCSFNININNQSTGASNYSWNFGDNTTSSAQNPSHTYSQPGNYTITLIVGGVTSCTDTATQNITINTLPSASFTQVLDTCGLSAVFNNTSLNVTQYSWSFGDASTSTQQNPSHVYSSSGSYTVNLTSTDANGCTATSSQSFTLPPLPVAAFTATPVVCTYNINITNQSAGASNYSWNFGDNTTSTAQNPSHTYSQPGNYTITLIVGGVTSCTDTATQNITINTLPSASFTQVLDTCGLSAVFNNTSLNVTQYSWSFGDASTSTQQNPSHAYSSSGSYTVNLTATDANGCTATAAQSFTLPSLPVASFTHQPDVCSRLVTFTNTSINEVSSSWDFGDASTSNLTNPTHTYAANGNYNVRLIVTSAHGCTDTIINPVVINFVPVVAAFNPVNTPCSFNVNFVNQSTGASIYNWNFGDASSSTQTNPSHTYPSTGNYTVTLIANNANGCSDTVSQNVTTPVLSQASFTYQVDTCSLTVNFTNNSTNANSYTWNFGDASSSSQTNPSHTYPATGNYNVSLIATTAAGCSDTASVPVPLSFTLPSAAFTVNQPPCSFSISLNDQSTGANNYAWDFGDNSGSNLQNPSHIYTQPGNYTIRLIVTGVASCADTVSQTVIINPLPAAAFNYVPNVCSLTAAFNNNSVNGASYSWNFGDATTSTLQNPVHSYSASGNYTVILTTTDIYGCTSIVTQIISFPPLPVSSFTHQPDLCSRLVTFNNTSVNAVSYSWNFGDATTSTVPNPTHTYAANGNYIVTLVSISASGCSDTLTTTITVNYIPVVPLFNIINVPCTFNASFNNQSTGATNFYWDFGDSYFSSQQNPSHIYSAPGTYTITLTATDANGCSATSSQNISLPTPSHAAFSYVTDSCTRLIVFTNNSVNGNSYYWNFGDATTSTLANPSHIYAANGNYSVMLISTSPAGCNDTLVVPVPITITLPVAAFTPANPVCSYNVNFTNLSSNASAYEWNFGDNMTSNLANPIHLYQNPGNYTVTLHVSTPAGCIDSTTNNLGVAPLPSASFTPVIDTCSLVAQFVNTSQNAIGYYWNFGDSTTSSAASPPPHTYPATGTYNIMLVVQDNNGCRDTMMQTVHPFIASHADYTFSIDSCDQKVNFFNGSDFAFSYLWNFGDGSTSNEISTQHHYTSDGNYPVLLITNPGTLCADSAEYNVDFSLAGIGNIYVPNAFTPNSDGKNDVFEIVGYYPCEDLTLYIFDRWGELIYKKSGKHITWDGNYLDNRVKLEVYVYILEGTYFYQNGTITVIR